MRDSVCQKNVPLCERFFLQPLIPLFSIAEFIFKKRYEIGSHFALMPVLGMRRPVMDPALAVDFLYFVFIMYNKLVLLTMTQTAFGCPNQHPLPGGQHEREN